MTWIVTESRVAFWGCCCLAAVSAFSLAGCRRPPTLVPVEGRVLLDGKPLVTGAIMVQPQAGPAAQAKIQTDGSFRLGTFTPEDGAIPGIAAVRVICRPEVTKPGEERTFGRSLIPEKYSQFESSGISVEIRDGMEPLVIELSAGKG